MSWHDRPGLRRSGPGNYVWTADVGEVGGLTGCHHRLKLFLVTLLTLDACWISSSWLTIFSDVVMIQMLLFELFTPDDTKLARILKKTSYYQTERVQPLRNQSAIVLLLLKKVEKNNWKPVCAAEKHYSAHNKTHPWVGGRGVWMDKTVLLNFCNIARD